MSPFFVLKKGDNFSKSSYPFRLLNADKKMELPGVLMQGQSEFRV